MTNKGHGARLGDFVMINHAKHAFRVSNNLFMHLNKSIKINIILTANSLLSVFCLILTGILERLICDIDCASRISILVYCCKFLPSLLSLRKSLFSPYVVGLELLGL